MRECFPSPTNGDWISLSFPESGEVSGDRNRPSSWSLLLQQTTNSSSHCPLTPAKELAPCCSSYLCPALDFRKTALISGLPHWKQDPDVKDTALEIKWKLAHQPSSAETSKCFLHYSQRAQQWDWAALGNKIGSFLLSQWNSEWEYSSHSILWSYQETQEPRKFICARDLFFMYILLSHTYSMFLTLSVLL